MKPTIFAIITAATLSFFLIPLVPSLAQEDRVLQQPERVPMEVEDIQWFKDELRISPKYIEHDEGILGMSWLHFLLMIFLIVFFVGALVAYFRQTNRTKRILQQLYEEEE